jgi:ABC-type cobalamin/Fe3+-siderophores transport system ATPase subunit
MPIPLYRITNLVIMNGKEERLQIKQFDIHRGACYVFEGQMGSGKTTLLDILYSRRKIGKGKIEFEEKDFHSYSNKEYNEQIAVVPQKFSPPWGIVENFMFKTIYRYSHIKNPDKRLDQIVQKMNISILLKRKMKSLTPGELRWVVLATQIAADTKVLFIDEY